MLSHKFVNKIHYMLHCLSLDQADGTIAVLAYDGMVDRQAVGKVRASALNTSMKIL